MIVLSHVAWNAQFAANPAVIGRSVQINGLPYEIVGVMPERLSWPADRRARLLGTARARRAVPR